MPAVRVCEFEFEFERFELELNLNAAEGAPLLSMPVLPGTSSYTPCTGKAQLKQSVERYSFDRQLLYPRDSDSSLKAP